jgi:hypothetical protein
MFHVVFGAPAAQRYPTPAAEATLLALGSHLKAGRAPGCPGRSILNRITEIVIVIALEQLVVYKILLFVFRFVR